MKRLLVLLGVALALTGCTGGTSEQTEPELAAAGIFTIPRGDRVVELAVYAKDSEGIEQRFEGQVLITYLAESPYTSGVSWDEQNVTSIEFTKTDFVDSTWRVEGAEERHLAARLTYEIPGWWKDSQTGKSYPLNSLSISNRASILLRAEVIVAGGSFEAMEFFFAPAEVW